MMAMLLILITSAVFGTAAVQAEEFAYFHKWAYDNE